jgi:flagellar P-ring protein precursor FlgI
MSSRPINRVAWLPLLLLAAFPIAAAQATTTIGSICRVKGQEKNTLHGMGMVVGLNGTGDGGDFMPTMRSLATSMELMGNPVGVADPSGVKNIYAELKSADNVALVTITATVPAGAREGDRLDCVVSSVGAAKSLEGGRLFFTLLAGPVPDREGRVYAFAQGPVSLDDPELARSGRIHGGCQLLEDFPSKFSKDGKITLVLDENHADFQVAHEVAEVINYEWSFRTSGQSVAKAMDQFNIEVAVPPEYQDHLVDFVSQILRLPMIREPQVTPRVVINERSGSIVIGGDVEIGPVVVTHKNVLIEMDHPAVGTRFVPIDPGEPQNPDLQALVTALDAVRVPNEDIIDIIKDLHRNGKLHAQLIIE